MFSSAGDNSKICDKLQNQEKLFACSPLLNLFSLVSCDNCSLGLLSTSHHTLQLRFGLGCKFNKQYGGTENPCGEGGVKQDFKLVKGFFSSLQVLSGHFSHFLQYSTAGQSYPYTDGCGNGTFCDLSAQDFLLSLPNLFITESQHVTQSSILYPRF